MPIDASHQEDVSEPPGEPFPRARSLLRWWEDGSDYFAGDYRLRLLGPGRWEISYRDAIIGYEDSRELAMRDADLHYREVIRSRDIWRWSVVAVVSAVAFGVVSVVTEVGDLWLQIVVAVLAFACLAALARLAAAATRNRVDPYRRRDPWERRDWWFRDRRHGS